ncbi:tripartite tricarboxylate transporter TctB family protein [Allopusillimonas ginsengisoli]|uniref:tripartite tricarboxylate transporter TctB family protein n=1 Tax=Allopusillimonas ginsengisoli TaxID=453575 RepID=UPI0010209C5F|nr:tripartite tricarboxylate transporter TctB family protein [Allopusillimonas ginsengisoli]TEA78210.1 tripartite tricarboxylate transporter TctB family protein [Allopusillimonas ginsengisoli]
MREDKKREWYAALLMILIGIGTAWGSLDYNVGTLGRMGPGYFPMLLGIVLTFVGVLILVTPAYPEEQAESDSHGSTSEARYLRHVRPVLATVIGMLAFIVFGKYGGLVPATFILIFISALGDRTTTLKATLLLAAGVTAAAVGIFHYGMQMQFPLFNWG